MKNRAAQALGRMAKGVKKTMSPAARQQRKAANRARWDKKVKREPLREELLAEASR